MKALMQIVAKGAFDGDGGSSSGFGAFFSRIPVEGTMVVAKSTSPQQRQQQQQILASAGSAKVITSNKEAATCSSAQVLWIFCRLVINLLVADLGTTSSTIALAK